MVGYLQPDVLRVVGVSEFAVGTGKEGMAKQARREGPALFKYRDTTRHLRFLCQGAATELNRCLGTSHRYMPNQLMEACWRASSQEAWQDQHPSSPASERYAPAALLREADLVNSPQVGQHRP